MTRDAKPPAKRPCASCPYRRDVPPGLWDPEEYAKLVPYDADTGQQPPSVFMCHQQDGAMCAGWVGCHGGENLLGIRLWLAFHPSVTEDVVASVYDYRTDVPLHPSGQAASDHGLARVDDPDERAQAAILRLQIKKRLRETRGGA